MNFKEYQTLAKGTVIHNAYEDDKLLLARFTLGLAGEAGETCEKIKKYLRDGMPLEEVKKKVSKELGDVQWYISSIASLLGLDLETIAKENIEKLYSRLERGKLTGSGDER